VQRLLVHARIAQPRHPDGERLSEWRYPLPAVYMRDTIDEPCLSALST
jgi:hypothetical protein